MFIPIFTNRKKKSGLFPSSFGSTFTKQFDKKQGTLNADTASGTKTATFTASRGSTTPATTIETQDGNTLLFDEVDDEVTIANADSGLQPSYPFSYVAKIRQESLTSAGIYVNSYSAANYQGALLHTGATGKISILLGDGAGANSTDRKSYETDGVITAGVDAHIVVVINSFADVDMYIDGVAQTPTSSGTGASMAYGSTAARLGNAVAGGFFNGQIKEFRQYNSALTAGNVATLYAGGTVAGAAAHWDMSDGTGTTLTDVAASFDGIIVGDAQWLTDGSTYVTKVTSEDTPRWTTGYYASNGVYTAGPGLLLEGASTNLVPKSYTMDDASWAATNVTVSDGAIADPMGGLNAASLTATAGNGTVLLAAGVTAQTYSVWLKRKTGTGNIDITADSGATYETKTLTTAWKRLEVTAASASQTCGIRIVTDTDAVYAWGNQFEAAAYPSSYIPTTSAALTRNAETLTYVANDGNFAGGTDGTIALVYRPIMLPDEQPGAGFSEYFVVNIDGSNYWRLRYAFLTNDKIDFLTNSAGTTETASSTAEPFSSTRYGLHSVINTYSTDADGSSNKLNFYVDGLVKGTNADYSVPVGSLPASFDIQSSVNQSMTLVAVVLFSNRLSASQVSDVHDLLT